MGDDKPLEEHRRVNRGLTAKVAAIALDAGIPLGASIFRLGRDSGYRAVGKMATAGNY